MDYKYNEREYGKVIFEKGFQSDFLRYELVVLVKYLKELGYKKKQTEEFLYKHCETHVKSFNKIKYYKVIDGAIRDGRRYDNKIIEVKEIPITKNEIEHIDSLDVDHEHKKLLFTMMVRKKISYAVNTINNSEAKLSSYFAGSKKSFREVFKMAKIKSGYNIDNMITELVRKGIITSVIKGDIVLDYMNKIEPCEELYDSIVDLENIGWYFDLYKGENKVGRCENADCGKPIKQFSNRSKYCTKCAKKINIQKTIENRKNRKLFDLEKPL
jgi:hypothetical protein